MDCAKCGKTTSDESSTCANCSTDSQPEARANGAKRLSGDFWLCLFFGWAGAHRFKRGEATIGVMMLLTCGGFIFGWIGDTIALATGTPLADGSKSTQSNTSSKTSRTSQKTPRVIKCAYRDCANERKTEFVDACCEEHRLLAREDRSEEMAQRAKALDSYDDRRAQQNAPTGQAAIVCPFCQTRGKVTVRLKEDIGSPWKLTKSLMSAGLAADHHKVMHCSNCRQKWDMGKATRFNL